MLKLGKKELDVLQRFHEAYRDHQKKLSIVGYPATIWYPQEEAA